MNAFTVFGGPGEGRLQTALDWESLAKVHGIKNVFVVGNKIKQESYKDFIARHLEGMLILGFMSYADDTVKADIDGKSPYDASPRAVEEAKIIMASLDRLMQTPSDK